MKKLLFYVVIICLIISLIIPSGLVQGMMNLASGPIASSGLYRTRVTIDQPYDLTRLQDLGIKILDQGSNWASVLVSDAQLENLARLGFEPQASNELSLLVSASADVSPWLASSLSAQLDRAISYTNSVESSQINKLDVDESTLIDIIEGFTIEQLSGIQALPGVDNDADGLTDTQEAWWCTDPNNMDSDGDGVTDGTEVIYIKDWLSNHGSGVPSAGKPFVGWPPDHVGCYDDDFDSVPDMAERWELGLNMNRESTDGDKFDDGQELFGITKSPGYGSLPPADDDLVTPNIPGWIDPPGNSPVVAAYPEISIDIIPNSLEIELVSEITVGETYGTGETFGYSTTNSKGLSTGVGKEETHTISEWQEVGNSYADSIERSSYTSTMQSEFQQYSVEHSIGTKLDTELNGSSELTIGVNASVGAEISADLDVGKAVMGAIKGGGVGALAGLGVGASVNAEVGGSIEQTYGASASLRRQTEEQTKTSHSGGYEISVEQGQSLSISSTQERSISNGVGHESSQATTITRENYNEFAVSNDHQIATSEEWSSATAVNSNHAANLTFAYQMKNSGTDNARLINNVMFNIYIEGHPNPITTYAGALIGNSCSQVEVINLFPNDVFPETGVATQCPIPLSLNQIERIDQGAAIRILVANYNWGIDGEQYYENAWGQGVIVEIDDDTWDGDEDIDSYLIPTWGIETYQDVVRRYFKGSETANGDLLTIFTPEYNENHEITEWNEYIVSDRSWFNIYLSDYGDGSNLPFRDKIAKPESRILLRFNKDTDLDNFSDRVEREYETNLDNGNDHPNATLIAGYHETRQGNEVQVQLALENFGDFSAFGVEAKMVSVDETVTIHNYLVGIGGLIPAGEKVILTSKVLDPELIFWQGTSKPSSNGYFSSMIDKSITLEVSSTGEVGIASELYLNWTSSDGSTGSLPIGVGYLPERKLLITDGIEVSMSSGIVEQGDSFTITGLSPKDVLSYTINQEPYTQPIIIISYNDPSGNKRISTSVQLTSIFDDLSQYINQVSDPPNLELDSLSNFNPNGDNQISLTLVNPRDETITNGQLLIAYAESETGEIVAGHQIDSSFFPGPNVFFDTFNTSEFSPSYDTNKEYKVKVLALDNQGIVVDIAYSQLKALGNSKPAKISLNFYDWDIGDIAKGKPVVNDLVIANTGFGKLWAWSGIGAPLQVVQVSTIHQLEPGEMKVIPLSLDTSSLPLGPYIGSLTLRTNDPDNPTIEISITGTIVSPTDPVTASADPYQPLTEKVYVNGPLAANTIATFNNAAQVSSGAEPIAFTDESGTILGKGEQFIGLDEGSIPLTCTGIGSTVDDLAAENLDLTGAIELEEYRTDFSRVYVWPDGHGIALSKLPDTDMSELQPDDTSNGSVLYDTYVNAYYPTATNTTESRLYIGNFPTYYKSNARTLIRFNLPSLPAYADIDEAKLRLYAYSWYNSNRIDTQIYRISGSWSESSYPTWNTQPSIDWNTIWSTAWVEKTEDYKYWTITGLVEAWYGGTTNNGLMLRANPENSNSVVFYSKEGTYPPLLIVTFHMTPPPSAPTLYAISNPDGDGAYSVDWSDVANTTSYSLEESFNSGAWNLIMNTGSSIYNASGRSAGTWCYRVKANNAYGSSGYSATQCTAVNPPPGTPAITTINNADGDGNYVVDWNDVPLAISYELQENHDGGAFTTIYSGAISAFTITGRSSGQWCYSAKAINPSGSSGWSSTQCVMVNTPPIVPVSLLPVDAANQLGRAVTFSWQESSDPDNYPGTPLKYHVEVTSSTGGGTQVSEWTTNRQITIVMPEDGDYSWRVEASDNISSSGWSTTRTLGVYSIERASTDQVSIALPASIETFANYNVLYGIPASFPTAITPTMVYLELPKRLYSSVSFDVLVNESVNENATFTLDIAADGSIEWSQNINWSAPAFFESPDLTAAINNFMAQSTLLGGELVSIPISVNYSSIGELYITDVEAHTGVDSDPQLNAGDLIISNTDPMETDVIGLTARVFNGGIFTANNIMVNFFAGDPDFGGKYIGSKLVSHILAGSYGDAVLNWDTSGYVGEQDIFAVVDYGSQIPEMDETNNITSKSLVIRNRPDLSIELISPSDYEPVVGESVTLMISTANLGESDAASSLVSVYIGDPLDGGGLLGEKFVEIMRQSTTNVNFNWTPDRTGWHRLYVLSDANDQVSEYDESNNQNWLDIYIGLEGPLLLDSGTDLDPIYSAETGYGYIDINQPDEPVSCGLNNLPEETLRRDPDGSVVYQFDHLLPGHFYHLDITLFECDGAGRQETVYVDGNQISEVEDLGDGLVHRLSLRLDPALYADRTILVVVNAEGIDGAVVSEVNLHDIDYRYADSGGNHDPQYPGDQGYGWIDGSPVLTWGTLPYQSVRVDQSDNTLNYRFDNLSPTKLYNVHFTFWQLSGTGRIQKIQVDGVDTGLSVNTGDYLRHQEKIAIPLSAYSSDGMVIINIVRTNATTGAMVNEIALEEETVLTNTSCVVQPTPYFSETYGSVLISGAAAPVGSVVQALNPRGDTVGCFTVTDEGLYGFLRIYGEDTSAVPPIPGMRKGEIVSYSVNGAPAVASPLYYWSDDHDTHAINLNAGNVTGQSVLLQPGWNLISFKVEPPAPIVSLVLQSIASRYDRVLSEDGVYVPSLPAEFNTLRELHSATGYYLRVTGTTSVSLLVEGIAQSCSEPKELHAGWNWIGAPCEVTETAAALMSIEGHYQRVLSLSKTYDPALPAFSTLKSLIPGEGYLIYITDPVTLIYPDVVLNTNMVETVIENSCGHVFATPFSTLAYGYVYVNSELAQEGTLVEFVTPRGELAGCSLIATGGMLPLTQIYGADGENIGGFFDGEQILVRVNGIVIAQPLEFTWKDDKTPHELSVNTTMHKIYLPLINH